MNLPSRLHSLFTRLTGQSLASAVEQPLLNDLELHLIHQHALTTHNNPFLMQQDVQHPLLGERTSSYAGSGYEFAEHRRYVNGDDMRFIDWRVMARTGKLYRKAFHEERRPQVYLIVDRRAPMRFATHTQLKVTCAARQAIRLLHQARQQQLLTGSVTLEHQATWLRPSLSRLENQNTIQQLNRPCPPLPFNAASIQLDAVLNELAVRITPGSILFLISDFHDLADSSSSVLYHLAQQHRLNAIQILDPAERHLPSGSQLPLYDEQTQDVLTLDPANPAVQQQFADAMQAAQQKIQNLIETAGGHYRLLMTNGGEHG